MIYVKQTVVQGIAGDGPPLSYHLESTDRSEERRVGKECSG